MPELPEVETVKEILKKILIGSKINKVMIFYERMILSPIKDFEKSLINKEIIDVSRKGKFLIIHFEDKTVLITHLRMEGKFIERKANEDVSSYARVVFYLNDGRKICFDDTRKFGIMKVSDEDHYLIEPPISNLGPEPFYIKDPYYLLEKYKRIKKPIKETLLDQSIIAGIGNIYADETLFRCSLHPLTAANELTLEDCRNVIENSINVLNKAITLGGSTIRSYHANGIDGKFQNELLAYGKEGQLCANNCSAHYKKIFVGGRGTTYCPLCQRKRNKTFTIGITGKIASGKSTIMKIFSKNNIKTLSADHIVADLYNTEEVKYRVCSLLGPDAYIEDKVNKEYIKKIISLNSKFKENLESILHPLVYEKIKEFINENTNEKIIAVEVPLLYETGMESLFDATLAIDASLSDQIANLQKRGSDIDSNLLLNKNNQFDKYKKKLTFLLHTNNDINEVEQQITTIINKIK
ncbi:MAG: DNA-formamidopyrimidine glycosylase [Bacilli bacterium]